MNKLYFFLLLLPLALPLACVSYSLANDLPHSQVLPPSAQSPLAQSIVPHQGRSGFLPLIAGSDAYDARAALTKTAVTSLDLQYYIWHRDKTGLALLSSLLDAAERGVRVRLLLDDINLGEDREFLAALDRHPQIEIRLFNPSSSDGVGLSRVTRNLQLVFDFNQMNRRMHNKVLIADSSYAVIGGRNIGDEYFDLKKDKSFRDLDVLTAGPVAVQLGEIFDDYWNSPLVFGLHAKGETVREATGEEWQKIRAALHITKASKSEAIFSDIPSTALTLGRITEFGKSLIWAPAQAMADAPQLEPEQGKGLEDKIMKWPMPKEELLIESAYFIPTEKLLHIFRDLGSEGVRIKVLTNSLQSNDVMLAHAGYMKKRDAILDTGADLYEWRMSKVRVKTGGGGMYASRAGLHSKTFVIDNEYVFIGSMNLDARSIKLNTESGMMIHSKELAKIIASFVSKGMGGESSWRVVRSCPDSPCQDSDKEVVWNGLKDGIQISVDNEPESSFWKRSAAKFMSHLPIEDKL